MDKKDSDQNNLEYSITTNELDEQARDATNESMLEKGLILPEDL